ncbi:sucrase ferredoxin, partial [Allocoleopsis sp.]|uniref:sucrase ferredoxin n=1 Tax=Allocoleopsis sp. TaxID=3088169 RepID=UPI002FD59202
ATVAELSLSNIRIWKSRHFGGHRSAPTIIDLPEGRYYGVLDAESFRFILMRTGNIKCLNRVYRGWGLLPIPLQIMERELILSYGWDWFNYKVAGRMLEPNSDNNVSQGEITLEKPDGSIYTYQAEIRRNQRQILQIAGSCNTLKESNIVNYSLKDLNLCIYDEPLQNALFYSEKIAG